MYTKLRVLYKKLVGMGSQFDQKVVEKLVGKQKFLPRPPQLWPKVTEGVFQSKNATWDFSYSRRFQPACKKLAISHGPFSRSHTKPSFFIGIGIFPAAGPLPRLNRKGCEEMHGHLGGRRGPEQVFASGQVFLFYRRVLCVNLCEV